MKIWDFSNNNKDHPGQGRNRVLLVYDGNKHRHLQKVAMKRDLMKEIKREIIYFDHINYEFNLGNENCMYVFVHTILIKPYLRETSKAGEEVVESHENRKATSGSGQTAACQRQGFGDPWQPTFIVAMTPG